MSIDRKPDIMQQLVVELETKNSELGGLLFADFGKGRSRFLMFPTPVQRRIKSAMTTDFLVVTGDGYKAIEVTRASGGIDPSDISDAIKLWIGRKPGFFSPNFKYRGDELIIDGLLHIYFNKTNDWHGVPKLGYGYKPKPKIYGNCRLVDAKEPLVERIIKANIRRIETMRRTSQRIEEMVGPVTGIPHL